MDKFVGFRASEKENDAVEVLSKKIGVSKSEVARRALRTYAAQHDIELPGVAA